MTAAVASYAPPAAGDFVYYNDGLIGILFDDDGMSLIQTITDSRYLMPYGADATTIRYADIKSFADDLAAEIRRALNAGHLDHLFSDGGSMLSFRMNLQWFVRSLRKTSHKLPETDKLINLFHVIARRRGILGDDKLMETAYFCCFGSFLQFDTFPQ